MKHVPMQLHNNYFSNNIPNKLNSHVQGGQNTSQMQLENYFFNNNPNKLNGQVRNT